MQGKIQKKMMQEEKQIRREERKKERNVLKGDSSSNVFKGFGQEDPSTSSDISRLKFTKAVPINGVKKILKATGDLVRSHIP